MGYLFQKRLYAIHLFFRPGSNCSMDAMFLADITRADRGRRILVATAWLH